MSHEDGYPRVCWLRHVMIEQFGVEDSGIGMKDSGIEKMKNKLVNNPGTIPKVWYIEDSGIEMTKNTGCEQIPGTIDMYGTTVFEGSV